VFEIVRTAESAAESVVETSVDVVGGVVLVAAEMAIVAAQVEAVDQFVFLRLALKLNLWIMLLLLLWRIEGRCVVIVYVSMTTDCVCVLRVEIRNIYIFYSLLLPLKRCRSVTISIRLSHVCVFVSRVPILDRIIIHRLLRLHLERLCFDT